NVFCREVLSPPGLSIPSMSLVKNLLAFLVACFCLSTAANAQRRIAADDAKKQLVAQLVAVNDGIIDSEIRRQLMSDVPQYAGALLDMDSVVSPIQTAQFI